MLTRRTIVAGFAAVAAATIAFANPVTRSIYPAPTEPLTLDGLPTGARFVDTTTADGLALKGIIVAPRDAMPLLLVFHGNASSASGIVRWFAPLIARGCGVLAAEYRGYSACQERRARRALGTMPTASPQRRASRQRARRSGWWGTALAVASHSTSRCGTALTWL